MGGERVKVWVTVLSKFVRKILTDNSSTEYRTNPRLGQTEYLVIFYNI